ncbi:Clathrin heavy chain [Sorochytrium milnesiophthora]
MASATLPDVCHVQWLGHNSLGVVADGRVYAMHIRQSTVTEELFGVHPDVAQLCVTHLECDNADSIKWVLVEATAESERVYQLHPQTGNGSQVIRASCARLCHTRHGVQLVGVTADRGQLLQVTAMPLSDAAACWSDAPSYPLPIAAQERVTCMQHTADNHVFLFTSGGEMVVWDLTSKSTLLQASVLPRDVRPLAVASWASEQPAVVLLDSQGTVTRIHCHTAQPRPQMSDGLHDLAIAPAYGTALDFQEVKSAHTPLTVRVPHGSGAATQKRRSALRKRASATKQLQELIVANDTSAMQLALSIAKDCGHDLPVIVTIAEILRQAGTAEATVHFLRHTLRDTPAHGPLQTLLLQSLAQLDSERFSALLNSGVYTHFSKDDVIRAAISHGLHDQALRLATTPAMFTSTSALICTQLATDNSLDSYMDAFTLLGSNFEQMLRSVLHDAERGDDQCQSALAMFEDQRRLRLLLEFLLSEGMHMLARWLLESADLVGHSSLQTIYIVLVMQSGNSESVRQALTKMTNYDVAEVCRSGLDLGYYEVNPLCAIVQHASISSHVQDVYYIMETHGMYADAAHVLVHDIKDLHRAFALAHRTNDSGAWQVVGRATYDLMQTDTVQLPRFLHGSKSV